MNDHDHKEEWAPSRSAKKRAARSVEDLAVRLTELSASDFRRLPVQGDVQRELETARNIKAHGARKRQIKHLAGLLRRDDETREAVEAFVSDLDQGRHREAERFHVLEELRERLCDPVQREDALREVRSILPDLEQAKVRRLAEAAAGGQDKRAFRELFRLLRTAEELLHQPPK